jgi:hypothetical protein
MKAVLTVLTLCLAAGPAMAQDLTVFSSDFGSAAAGQTWGDVRTHRLHLEVGTQTNLGPARVYLGMRYQMLGLSGTPYANSNLNQVRPILSAAFGGGAWTLRTYVAPGITLDGFSPGSGIDVRTAALAERRRGAWVLGAGIAYRNRLNLKVAPVFIAKGPLGDRWSLDVTAPAHATVWYGGGQRRAGMRFRYSTLLFATDEVTGYNQLEHAQIVAGPAFEQRLLGPVAFRVEVAMTLLNRLEWEGTAISEQARLDSGVVFHSALIIRGDS